MRNKRRVEMEERNQKENNKGERRLINKDRKKRTKVNQKGR